MKTNRLIILVILLITGSFFVNISAQEALRAIAKKCETLDNIECNIVKSRNHKTQEVAHYMMSFKFSKNETLRKEILAAFEKDKGVAIRESIRKKDGLMNITYFFVNGQYSFKEDENGDMIFTARDILSKKDTVGFINNSIEVPLSYNLSNRARGMEELNKERARALKERAKVRNEHMKERAKAMEQLNKERAKVLKERERLRIEQMKVRAKIIL